MADFGVPSLMLSGLVEIQLPSGPLRLCDGGFVYWGADKYSSSDEDFGAIEAIDVIDDKVGDEAPAGSLTFLPSSAASVATLSQASFQGSPFRLWLARVEPTTGVLNGTPDLIFDGELDTVTLRVSRGARALDMGFISIAERLFQINEGNVLSTRYHKSVWPGEQGLDNATGVGTVVPWGVVSPPRGMTSSDRGAIGGFISGAFS